MLTIVPLACANLHLPPPDFQLPQVFFVRDGMKFPDMVHALKPNPKNHLQEGWRIADFFSHHPESMHMVCCC